MNKEELEREIAILLKRIDQRRRVIRTAQISLAELTSELACRRAELNVLPAGEAQK